MQSQKDYLTGDRALLPAANARLVLTAPQNSGEGELPMLTLSRNPQARGFRLILEGSSDLSQWPRLWRQ